mmetsp:Transcript_88159/g.269771  ORF Transcript_88159/g.269771 Transcript_88159/m.269771 type:complete len:231 (+) Transcript_88159:453-1145(+)
MAAMIVLLPLAASSSLPACPWPQRVSQGKSSGGCGPWPRTIRSTSASARTWSTSGRCLGRPARRTRWTSRPPRLRWMTSISGCAGRSAGSWNTWPCGSLVARSRRRSFAWMGRLALGRPPWGRRWRRPSGASSGASRWAGCATRRSFEATGGLILAAVLGRSCRVCRPSRSTTQCSYWTRLTSSYAARNSTRRLCFWRFWTQSRTRSSRTATSACHSTSPASSSCAPPTK